MTNVRYIRNFCIIAHVDHGKTTLVDRFIEICSDIKLKNSCVLDSSVIEKERQITIRAHCLTLTYEYKNIVYTLNIIDTPGHGDFIFEVYNKLFACDIAILLVDATRGIEAQTLVVYDIMKKCKITIIPVLNKIDLSYIDLESRISEMYIIDNSFNRDTIITISAKTGQGVENLLQKILNIEYCNDFFINNEKNNFVGTIIGRQFEDHIGVLLFILVNVGSIGKNDFILYKYNKSFLKFRVNKIGINIPNKVYKEHLYTGEIGFLILNEKNVGIFQIGSCLVKTQGNSVQIDKNICIQNEKKNLQHFIFSEIFPVFKEDYNLLKYSLNKLYLIDSFSLESCISYLFGPGFRCGFFGFLHLEILKENIEHNFNIRVFITKPIPTFKVYLKTKKIIYVNNILQWPISNLIDIVYEQFYKVIIIIPYIFIANVLNLCKESRSIVENYQGLLQTKNFDTKNHIIITCLVPAEEILENFFTMLKECTKGYSKFSYYFFEYREIDIVKVDIIINKRIIDNLAFLTHRKNSIKKSEVFLNKLSKVLKKQLYKIRISTCIGSKIIKSVTIEEKKKNVLSKCYGGDRTRKKKLLEKQKRGKKKLKNLNNKQRNIVERNNLISLFS